MNDADNPIRKNVASLWFARFRENTTNFKIEWRSLFELLLTFLPSELVECSFSEDIILFIMSGSVDKLVAFVYINRNHDKHVFR